jgi:hypothetical protein
VLNINLPAVFPLMADSVILAESSWDSEPVLPFPEAWLEQAAAAERA